jgi:hypothetical protein
MAQLKRSLMPILFLSAGLCLLAACKPTVDAQADSGVSKPIEESEFCASLKSGKFILPAKPGWWNWCMAPIYDEAGKLHVFVSAIPNDGKWQENSIIQHFTADSVEGPFELVDVPFSSKDTTYHNPQVTKVGDTYVMVYLMNDPAKLPKRVQAVGLATAKSLNGPWTPSPHNPVLKPTDIPSHFRATHASNPTFLVDREGKYRLYYKAISDKIPDFRTICLATADAIEGPYTDHPANPLISYEDIQRDIEDPYAFFYKDTYYMILEDRMDVKGALEGKIGPDSQVESGGLRPGLIYTSKDGIHWGVPEIGYQTNTHYFGGELTRSERPNILWKDGKPEYLFLASHGKNREAGFFLKIGDWP